MPVSLLIADDQEIVRAGLKSIFQSTDIEVKAEASTGEETLSLLGAQRFDVVLLDVRMGGGDGLQVLGRIKIDHPNTPVVIFSAYDNPTYVARAVALGGSGFVHKSEPTEKLVEAIRIAANGGSSWTRDELRRMTGALATPRVGIDVEVPLTQRESEVLKYLSSGLTNKEIAQSLNISYETVKEHVQHILRKIGVTDRTQAAVWAVRNNLA